MNIPWHRRTTEPLVLLLATAPALAVAQFRGLAVAVTLALVLTVVAHRRLRGVWPWPKPGWVGGFAAALLGWSLLASAWSPEAARGVQTTAALAALLLLALGSARVVAEAPAEEMRRIGLALAGGLAAGFALAAIDHASGNTLRLAVRGFPADMPGISFGLKPAMSFMVLLLPLVLAVSVARWVRAALVLGGLAVVLWLPADSAKIAAIAGLAAAALAIVLPRAAVRLAALAFAGFILAAPLVFAVALARAPSLESLPRSAAHRVLIWDFVGDRIAERPWFGWGMESARSIPGGSDTFPVADLARFGLTSPQALDWFAVPSARRLPLHTHNASLQIWLELGLVGALLAAGLAAAAMLATTGSPAAFGMAVSAAVTGQLSFGAWQPWWVAAVMFAGVVAIALRRHRGLVPPPV